VLYYIVGMVPSDKPLTKEVERIVSTSESTFAYQEYGVETFYPFGA
jgi:hypothetical protein